MDKKIIIAISACLIIAAAAAVFLFLKSSSLNNELAQNRQISQKMQDEIKRLDSEKTKAERDNEKLQQDALSYVNSNSKLQQEKEDAEKKLDAAKGLLKRKEAELIKTKDKLDELNAQASNQQASAESKVSREKEELANTISVLEAQLKKERALYHYNLAVAYTQAKLYDDALEAYDKSLALNPDNPEAYYNLGLLYSDVKNQPKKAAEFYKKYLELKPDAPDRDDVQILIDKLK